MVLGGGEPAAAHEANPGVRIELDALPAQLDGIDVAVVTSVTDQLVLSNPGEDVLEVLDDEGVAFLRIGAGQVEANTSSAGWYLTNNPFGLSELPEELPEEPAWATVAAEPSWGWFDHRLHPAGMVPPAEVVEAGEETVLATWRVPVRYRGADVDITGRIVFRPIRGSITAELRDAPDVDGVAVAVLQGRVPGLFLDNTSGRRVTVLGAEGEPFLRFDANGVEANVHSPSWLAARRAEGGGFAEVVIDADRPPTWRRVSQVPRLGWIEPRAAYPDEEPPPNIAQSGVTTTLLEWSVPLRVGGDEVAVSGVTTWEPLRTTAAGGEPGGTGSGGRWGVLGFAGLAVAVAAVPWLRRGWERLVGRRA